MEGMLAYQKYIAVKLHFTTDYDYFKYRGKSRRISSNKFAARKDRFYFQRIERRFPELELVDYFVANFVAKNSSGAWIGELSGPRAEQIYEAWVERHKNFESWFSADMKRIKDAAPTVLESTDVADMWSPNDLAQHPEVLRMHLASIVGLESLVVANKVIGFVPKWDKNIAEDFIWPTVSKSIKDYDPFLKVDVPRARKIMRDIFS